MQVFLNGRIVPESEATVSVLDRGFLYGDGLFETVRVFNGKPFRWAPHFQRLRKGAGFLAIPFSWSDAELTLAISDLLQRNGLSDGLLRLTLSRGIGPRGYSAKGANQPTLVITTHPLQIGQGLLQWKLAVSSLRVAAGDPLLTLKTANKLLNILARSEAEARGADEALLINTDGHLVEAASCNLFWIEQGTVCTAPLDAGALEGVTRELVQEICRGLGIPTAFKRISPPALYSAEGTFLTLSSLGIVEAVELDDQPLPRTKLTARLAESFQLQLLAEC
jgi:aminodeoxychorismate lyase